MFLSLPSFKFHVGEQDGFVSADRWTVVLYVSGPSFIAGVETTIELGQLVLQISESNIDVDPKKIRFPIVVVDCS
jgi:hypothetical protein